MVTPAQAVRRKRALKAYAVKHHIPIPNGFNLAGFVGPVARKLLRKVQQHAFPKHAPTGEFDSRTLALLFPAKPFPVGQAALKFATCELGIKEHPAGSNSGPRVSEYQATTGAYHAPWCASFVTWALRQAAWKQTGWNQAYVPAWVATAHLGRHGLRVIGSRDVKPGDIVCFDWEHNGVADHIGFCASVVRGGEFHTVEGNTSTSSNSNGGQVMSRMRSIGDVACFVRVA